MTKHYPGGDLNNSINVTAYLLAEALEKVLVSCGDDLSRKNVMRQAANLNGFESRLLLPGVQIRPLAKDYLVVRNLQMSRFDGESYRAIGPILELQR